MTETETPNNQSELAQELHALDGDPDLGKLETLNRRFNFFEALGLIHLERPHSDFLAFLLNPLQTHGLGDAFAKRFLTKVLSSPGSPILPGSMDLSNLSNTIVKREWRFIDILLLDADKHLAVIIENKIHSAEIPNQLADYRQTVLMHYPAWHLICIYLTPPRRLDPSDENYIHIHYDLICNIIEELVESPSSTIVADARIMMRHYASALRRHIVNDEIAELCQRIYSKHRGALDTIYKYRGAQVATLATFLKGLIGSVSSLKQDDSTNNTVRFGIDEWDVPILKAARGWTSSQRILLFVFNNYPGSLELALYVGPAPDDTRRQLREMASNNPPLGPAQAEGRWIKIYTSQFLAPDQYDEIGTDDVTRIVKEEWDRFLSEDLPRIKSIVKTQEWIWKS